MNDAADPYLAALGQIRYYMGTGEKSRYIKLIHQMLIAGVMQIWGEGLVMGEKAGLDWRLMMEVLSNSAVGSPAVKGKIPTLAERVYDWRAIGARYAELLEALGVESAAP